jgi:hypothetical protein
VVPGGDAEARHGSPIELQHRRHRLPEDIVSSEPGTVRSAMRTMRPSAAMNSMSSGISVFFIHIITSRSWP